LGWLLSTVCDFFRPVLLNELIEESKAPRCTDASPPPADDVTLMLGGGGGGGGGGGAPRTGGGVGGCGGTGDGELDVAGETVADESPDRDKTGDLWGLRLALGDNSSDPLPF